MGRFHGYRSRDGRNRLSQFLAAYSFTTASRFSAALETSIHRSQLWSGDRFINFTLPKVQQLGRGHRIFGVRRSELCQLALENVFFTRTPVSRKQYSAEKVQARLRVRGFANYALCQFARGFQPQRFIHRYKSLEWGVGTLPASTSRVAHWRVERVHVGHRCHALPEGIKASAVECVTVVLDILPVLLAS